MIEHIDFDTNERFFNAIMFHLIVAKIDKDNQWHYQQRNMTKVTMCERLYYKIPLHVKIYQSHRPRTANSGKPFNSSYRKYKHVHVFQTISCDKDSQHVCTKSVVVMLPMDVKIHQGFK